MLPIPSVESAAPPGGLVDTSKEALDRDLLANANRRRLESDRHTSVC